MSVIKKCNYLYELGRKIKFGELYFSDIEEIKEAIGWIEGFGGYKDSHFLCLDTKKQRSRHAIN